MSIIHKLSSLLVPVAPGWMDVTHEVGEEAPFTLAKGDGVGVLQFSVASYDAGKRPVVELAHLRRLLDDFSESRELGRGKELIETERPTLVVGRTFDFGEKFIAAWYCSNGTDIALVTYSSEVGLQPSELNECVVMVKALRFEQPSSEVNGK